MFRRKKNFKDLANIIVSDETNINIIEEFRTIQTNINFSMIDTNLKSIVITSANRSSGKTFLAINLSLIFAKEDFEVLLIDADLRKPRIHQHFDLPNNAGLTTIIRKPERRIEDIIFQMDIPGLNLLTSGLLPPNPSEVLGSNRMNKVIKEMEEKYDLIIFDAPPLLPIVDAQIVANRVDGTIFVIPKGEVTKEEVYKSKNILELAEATVIGVIINKVEKRMENYY